MTQNRHVFDNLKENAGIYFSQVAPAPHDISVFVAGVDPHRKQDF